MNRFALALTLLVITFARLNRIFFKQNGSFRLERIMAQLEVPSDTTPPLPSKTAEILKQTFYYLDKGNECFVFISEDQKWVVKFIRMDRCHNLKEALDRFDQAHHELPHETRVIYAHTKKTRHLPKVRLVDRLSNAYHLDLNQLPFLIQRAGVPYFEALENSSAPVEILEKTVQIYSDLHDKRIIDADSIFEKNVGVVDNTPFIIDVGHLAKMTTPLSRNDYLDKMLVSLKDHLAKNFPQLHQVYKNLLDRKILVRNNAVEVKQ